MLQTKLKKTTASLFIKFLLKYNAAEDEEELNVKIENYSIYKKSCQPKMQSFWTFFRLVSRCTFGKISLVYLCNICKKEKQKNVSFHSIPFQPWSTSSQKGKVIRIITFTLNRNNPSWIWWKKKNDISWWFLQKEGTFMSSSFQFFMIKAKISHSCLNYRQICFISFFTDGDLDCHQWII